MPSSRYRLDEAFARGLAVGAHVPSNAAFLAELRGAKPSPGGLVPYARVTAAPYVGPVAWPFPQMVRGQRWILHLDGASVRQIDPGTGAVSVLALYDARDPETPAAIPAGGIWHVADWGAFWMALNGACAVYRLPGEDFARVETQCFPKTGCSFRGRPVFGNVVGYAGEWSAFWETWQAEVDEAVRATPTLDGNSVCWGSIEGGDALHWFRCDLAQTGWMPGAYDAQRPLWHEKLRQNQVGFQSMAWPGDVVRVLPLEEAVIVYGTHNVTALVPVAGPYPTFGVKEIAPVGIPGRGAAGGTDAEHVFLDAKGVLYVLRGNLTVERLDYSRYLAPMAVETPLVVPGPVESEFYLSSSGRAFLLTQHGLASIGEQVSGAYPAGGGMTGAAKALQGQSGFRAVSWTLDFGVRGVKTVTGVQLGMRYPAFLNVSVEYRGDTGAQWQATAPVAPTRDGYVPVHVSGAEFRIVLTGNEAPDLDCVDVVWNAGGKARYGTL